MSIWDAWYFLLLLALGFACLTISTRVHLSVGVLTFVAGSSMLWISCFRENSYASWMSALDIAALGNRAQSSFLSFFLIAGMSWTIANAWHQWCGPILKWIGGVNALFILTGFGFGLPVGLGWNASMAGCLSALLIPFAGDLGWILILSIPLTQSYMAVATSIGVGISMIAQSRYGQRAN